MKRLALVIIFLSLAINVYSSIFTEKEYICPICSNKFICTSQESYSIFGRYLDLKPFGAAIIPNPIPKCNICNFVFDENYFSENEILLLKSYILSDLIKNQVYQYTNYYYLAKEMEFVGRNISDIAWMYVCGFWENKKIEYNNYLMQNAISYLRLVTEESEFYFSSLIIIMDFYRRLGDKENCKNIIEIIKNDDNLYFDKYIEIVDLQEQLLDKNDRDEHIIP
jgi:hypothetical protein